jgi:hypothetical protein
MRFITISFLAVLLLCPPAAATIINFQFSCEGMIESTSLESFGISDGDIVDYKGSFVIDTGLITIDDYSVWPSGNVSSLHASGDYVISGAITVNEFIFPVLPYSQERFSFDDASVGGTHPDVVWFGFELYSPFTGSTARQFFDDMSIPALSEDHLMSSPDPLSDSFLAIYNLWYAVLRDDAMYLHPNGQIEYQIAAMPVPEPSTIALFSIGLVGLVVSTRKYRRG